MVHHGGVRAEPPWRPKFKAFSAGSQPAGKVNPFALQVLRLAHYDTSGLRSKPWDEFAAPGAPKLDFVFTVCDNAAQEVCPFWPRSTDDSALGPSPTQRAQKVVMPSDSSFSLILCGSLATASVSS
jgi:protein-tyrosine-phosphatase